MAESTVLKISSVYLKRDYWGGPALPYPSGSSAKQHWGGCTKNWMPRVADIRVLPLLCLPLQ